MNLWDSSDTRREVWECAVSWSWLLNFSRTRQSELYGLSTQQVVTKLIIPETKEKQLRYVDILPEVCVSAPTYFVSHVWASPFLELVSSLQSYINLSETDRKSKYTYLWIDVFAVNQHRESTEQASDLRDLHLAIKNATASTLVCLDNQGKLLTRIWCLFEIWQTFQLGISRLIVIAQNIDFDQLKEVFINCDVEKAEATVMSDRDRILGEIKKTVRFEEMNSSIKKSLLESSKYEVGNIQKMEESIESAKKLVKYAKFLLFTESTYGEALPLFLKAQSIFEKLFGPEDAHVASLLNDIGNIYKDTGKQTEALPLLRKALEIHLKCCGESDPDTSTSLNSLGNLLSKLGSHEEALLLLNQSLSIREAIFGLEHPLSAASLNNIANVYKRTGDFQSALPIQMQALAIREKIHGPEHPLTAISLNNLAILLTAMERYDEVKPLYKRALKIREKVLGTEHHTTANSYNNLGTIYSNLGNYPKALKLYEKALEIDRKVLGEEHPNTVEDMYNIGKVLKKMDRFPEAKPILEKALQIDEKIRGLESPFKDRLLEPISQIPLKVNLLLAKDHVDIKTPFSVKWELLLGTSTNYDWIGLYKADEADNKNYITYQWRGSGEKGGEISFESPVNYGEYEVRYLPYKSDVHIASVKLNVVPQIEITANWYKVSKKIVVKWSSKLENDYRGAWIGLYEKTETNPKQYLTWDYVKTQEVHLEPPLKSGEYNARFMYANTEVAASNTFTLERSNALVAEMKSEDIILVKVSVVSFDPYYESAWIGLYLKSEVNNKMFITWKYVTKSECELEFKAPKSTGEYEFRLFAYKKPKKLILISNSLQINV